MTKDGPAPDTISFNSAIVACNMQGARARSLLSDMNNCGVKPDLDTFVNVIRALENVQAADEALAVTTLLPHFPSPPVALFVTITTAFLSLQTALTVISVLTGIRAGCAERVGRAPLACVETLYRTKREPEHEPCVHSPRSELSRGVGQSTRPLNYSGRVGCRGGR